MQQDCYAMEQHTWAKRRSSLMVKPDVYVLRIACTQIPFELIVCTKRLGLRLRQDY